MAPPDLAQRLTRLCVQLSHLPHALFLTPRWLLLEGDSSLRGAESPDGVDLDDLLQARGGSTKSRTVACYCAARMMPLLPVATFGSGSILHRSLRSERQPAFATYEAAPTLASRLCSAPTPVGWRWAAGTTLSTCTTMCLKTTPPTTTARSRTRRTRAASRWCGLPFVASTSSLVR
eukprot:6178852-Pleurochrysis_carterae.AAC.1